MDLVSLYGKGCDEVALKKRYADLAARFEKREGAPCERVYSSSGRAEILGNHTDHNHGKVMVAAISCDILACVKMAKDKITVVSEGFPPIEVNVCDTEPREREKGTSAALVRGVVKALKDRGFEFGGFTAHMTSNIYRGAGVSSSAAFEVLIAEIINDLYLGGKLSPVEKAVVSQYAENVYFGKPCGLLDQSGIAIGSLSALDFFTPENPVIEKLPPIEGYSLVITNTGGDHASLTPHYAAIRAEMNEVAGYFGKGVLRDVDYAEFISALPSLKERFTGRAVMRALHFFKENERVERAANAVKRGNTGDFLSCVNESGLSSLNLLQNCAVPGDEMQPVILGIELSRNFLKDGAVRVHGGGFAGSILAVVSDAETESYMEFMKKLFGKENVFRAAVRPLGTTLVETL
ncbi:MAG: galactokinase [Clostridia bacterium]|nr:galactokinase [Clostridia bacterium]